MPSCWTFGTLRKKHMTQIQVTLDKVLACVSVRCAVRPQAIPPPPAPHDAPPGVSPTSSSHTLPSPCPAVKLKICRESYSDYEVAADLINKEYDLAMLNFKLGQHLPCSCCGPSWFIWTVGSVLGALGRPANSNGPLPCSTTVCCHLYNYSPLYLNMQGLLEARRAHTPPVLPSCSPSHSSPSFTRCITTLTTHFRCNPGRMLGVVWSLSGIVSRHLSIYNMNVCHFCV